MRAGPEGAGGPRNRMQAARQGIEVSNSHSTPRLAGRRQESLEDRNWAWRITPIARKEEGPHQTVPGAR